MRVTAHAHQAMVEEDFLLDDLLYVIGNSQVIEDYPEHRRGACCLLYGTTMSGRPMHIVCTTRLPVLVIVTVYEPRPPKWISPTRRKL